jgi:hypothetical protein
MICYDPLVRDRLRKNPERLQMIQVANTIIQVYQDQGFDLTLRQVYYQFVAHDHFPDSRKWRWTGTRWIHDPNGTKNAEPNYKWLGDVIADGRLAGLVDWEAIVDRTRSLKTLAHWEDPPEIVKAVSEQFRIDKWATQPNRVEVWIEKDALAGVIQGVCQELDVPYFSCRGYTSLSEIWAAGMRLKGYAEGGQPPIVLHFGDHDPSGIDMTRDITDRLRMFMGKHRQGLDVRRLALTMDQVETYNPPPNPAKTTDARFQSYSAIHGDESWELDALEPAVLAALIRNEVMGIREVDAWDEAVQQEDKGRRQLELISDRYDDVTTFLETEEG